MRRRTAMFMVAVSMSFTAAAVPTEIPHQGRLIDATGAPLSGAHDLQFSLYDAPAGGVEIWSETLTAVPLSEGYFSVRLGQQRALDHRILDGDELYLALSIDGGAPLERIAITSVPYAVRANTTTSLSGGTVDATSISINGTEVISSDGAVSWSSLRDIPADIADGDTLDGLACAAGQVAAWSASEWVCADDQVLTESAVETLVTNSPLDFAAGSTVGGDAILTSASSIAYSQLTGVPADNDTTYGAGSGITLSGTTFSLDRTVVTTIAQEAAAAGRLIASAGPTAVSKIWKMSVFRDGNGTLHYTAPDGITDSLDIKGMNGGEIRVGARKKIAFQAGAEGMLLLNLEGSSYHCTLLSAEDDQPNKGMYWATDGGNTGVNIAAWGNNHTSTFMLQRDGEPVPLKLNQQHMVICF